MLWHGSGCFDCFILKPLPLEFFSTLNCLRPRSMHLKIWNTVNITSKPIEILWAPWIQQNYKSYLLSINQFLLQERLTLFFDCSREATLLFEVKGYCSIGKDSLPINWLVLHWVGAKFNCFDQIARLSICNCTFER